MKKVNVSIIVPVYNVEKFLDRCLESLINQTLKNIEIICINDGSTDNSSKILNNYTLKDSRIVIINQENQGQSIARNKGMEIANGEYIGFVDSDDWVDLDFFEKLYNAAKDNDCDIAASGIIRLHKLNKKFHLKFENQSITSEVNKKFELCDVPEMSYIWNKIYKLEKIRKFNLKFKEKMYFEDVIFTPQVLFYSDKLITVPGTFYYYWRNSNSTVAQRNERINKDSVFAHLEANNFIKNHNIDISTHEPVTKRYKILGMTIFKIRSKGKSKTYILFNIFKWKVS